MKKECKKRMEKRDENMKEITGRNYTNAERKKEKMDRKKRNVGR